MYFKAIIFVVSNGDSEQDSMKLFSEQVTLGKVLVYFCLSESQATCVSMC